MSRKRNRPAPPRAHRKPHTLKTHGHSRVDEYFWLRDDTRENEQVLNYLQQENAYAESVLGAKAPAVHEQLYQELIERMKPDDASVPVREGDYWYYSRYEAGREHPIYARRKHTMQAEEEIILDTNVLAEPHEFFDLGDMDVSDDGNLLAYTQDTVSRGIYTLQVKDLRTGELLPEAIDGLSEPVVWGADNRTVYYIRQQQETMIPRYVLRHTLGRHSDTDTLLHEETDSTFYCDIERSRDRKHVLLEITSTQSSEVHLLDAHNPDAQFQPVLPREPDHEYQVEPVGDTLYLRTNWLAPNFRLMRAPLGNAADKTQWQEVRGEGAHTLLEDFVVFEHFLVVEETCDANTRLQVIPTGEGDATPWYIAAEGDEPAFAASIDDNPQYKSHVLRYSYTSLSTPDSIFDLDLRSGEKTLLKRDFAGADFDSDRYQVVRINVPARDGELVPVSMLMRKGTQADGTHPLYLLGYGAYGISYEAGFNSRYLSLVDRGFVFALAHIRGGQDKGRQWYEQGRLEHKQNTFNDFIDVAERLIEQGWADRNKLVGCGRSAGGLLIGAVANKSPQSFALLVAGVPFVDVVTTMLDDSIPLTTFEYDEWGNPSYKADYDRMLAYSPYDQIQAQAYPHIFVFTGLWDPAVQYWEPAKWVAKLRAHKTDDNLLVMHTDMHAGHTGAAARFRRMRDYAREYTFILMALGLH